MMLFRTRSVRTRRGVTLVELLVTLVIGAFLWTLGLKAGVQAGATRSPEEVCRMNRLRLNQTLAVWAHDGGGAPVALTEGLVRDEFLAKGLLQAMPVCRNGEDQAWPYSLTVEGAVSCRHHGEGGGPPSTPPDGLTMADVVSALVSSLRFGLQCGLVLLVMVGISRADLGRSGSRARPGELARVNRSVQSWMTRFNEQQIQRAADEKIERVRRRTRAAQSGSELVEDMAVMVAEITPAVVGRCPVCATDAPHGEAPCPECEAPHHVECYAYNRGCGIYGCVGAP